MKTSVTMRLSGMPRRLVGAALVALPALLFGAPASADSFSFSYSSGPGYKGGHGVHRHYVAPRHVHRHRHVHRAHVRYVYRPPVVYHRTRTVVVDRPVIVDRPVVVAHAPVCSHGLWRHLDGMVVEGVACKQPDGTWRIE